MLVLSCIIFHSHAAIMEFMKILNDPWAVSNLNSFLKTQPKITKSSYKHIQCEMWDTVTNDNGFIKDNIDLESNSQCV